MEREQQLWTEEGLLTWDGRVLELFKTEGKIGRWRVHAATMVRWELEQRRGVSLLKVYDHDQHDESVLVVDSLRPTVQAVMAEVEAVH